MRALIKMSHSKGCNEGPVYIHSFTLLARGCGFALASKTIRTLVVQSNLNYPDSLGLDEIVRIIEGPDNRGSG